MNCIAAISSSPPELFDFNSMMQYTRGNQGYYHDIVRVVYSKRPKREELHQLQRLLQQGRAFLCDPSISYGKVRTHALFLFATTPINLCVIVFFNLPISHISLNERKHQRLTKPCSFSPALQTPNAQTILSILPPRAPP